MCTRSITGDRRLITLDLHQRLYTASDRSSTIKPPPLDPPALMLEDRVRCYLPYLITH
ncbi:hypothetical protein F2Q70_00013991 [Brassica cretica]|uniref:Uncharacterized protein n=1 Tax=Brassica cretica TaxID=69181 RepID=A0A8S9HPD7_BRACR|nr:hypothetical protein F2Q70_00013991 [Brassica cretica]